MSKKPQFHFKTTLFKAIEVATAITVEGYEIEEFEDEDGVQRLSCCEEEFSWNFRDQDIEIDDSGDCKADCVDEDGDPVGPASINFAISKPLTAADLED